jgi:hypothetical protein
VTTDEGSNSRPRKAAGPDRPAYFDHADIDRVMAVLLALVAEVASIRERLDTHERVAAEGSAPAPALVEGYVADPATEQSREVWRDAYIRRLFRVITEDIDDLRAGGGTA